MPAAVLGISSTKEAKPVVTGITSSIFTEVVLDSLYNISMSVTL